MQHSRRRARTRARRNQGISTGRHPRLSARLDGERNMSGSVLVTGANRGIGQALAVAVAAAGFDVVLHGRDAARLADTRAKVAALGRQTRELIFDIADRDAAAMAISADLEAHGAYSGLVCNSGSARAGPFPAPAQPQSLGQGQSVAGRVGI